MTDSPDPLSALRAEIDALDDAMHDLLMRRAAVVARLASSRAKGRGPVLRPGREAAVLRRLLARHAGPLPRAALVRIWREVMAGHSEIQGGVAVAAALPGAEGPALLRAHLGGAAAIRPAASPAEALAAVLEGAAGLAALPDPFAPDQSWWAALDPRLHVVALLPVFGPGGAGLVLVSAAAPDPSGDDRTLVLLPAGAATTGALRVAAAGGAILAEYAGFPGQARLPDQARCLGAYATPDPGALA